MNIKSILWLCLMSLSMNLIAQTPELINYQAIVRTANNTVITDQSVGVKFVITLGTATGVVVYEETQTPITNSHGLINLKIGTGTIITGTLGTINWSADSHFLTTEIDPDGGTNYTLMGTSELVSVPYALHAKTVEEKDDADADPTNELQDLQLVGTNLSITNNVTATVLDLSTIDTKLDESEVDTFVSNNGYIELPVGGSNGQVLETDGSGVYSWVTQATSVQLTEAEVVNFVTDNGFISTEVDGSVTNEIQTLSVVGNDLTISGTGGNTITLPTGASGFKIGQHLNGGIIVFVDSSGLHGLIASKTDLPGTYKYQDESTLVQVSGATSYYDGTANTAALVAAPGTYAAADACVAFGEGWYLPSYTELVMVLNNSYASRGLDFVAAIYWSSTTTTAPSGSSNAATFYLAGSANFSTSAGTACKVRPVRKF